MELMAQLDAAVRKSEKGNTGNGGFMDGE